ncbi:hypothetical protein WA588_000258 [Blastocystis sp. NMH]
MSLEKRNVPREEQFVEVLDRAIGKIAKNVPGRTIASCYSQASGDDMLFIEIASNKMMDQFKEELHTELVNQCRSKGVFEYLKQLDERDETLQERRELEENYCGNAVDVNKLLEAQRMRLKKRLIRSLEQEIRSIEGELRAYYAENKGDVDRITKGVAYLKSVSHSAVS